MNPTTYDSVKGVLIKNNLVILWYYFMFSFCALMPADVCQSILNTFFKMNLRLFLYLDFLLSESRRNFLGRIRDCFYFIKGIKSFCKC
jgi:hypothetical protein